MMPTQTNSFASISKNKWIFTREQEWAIAEWLLSRHSSIEKQIEIHAKHSASVVGSACGRVCVRRKERKIMCGRWQRISNVKRRNSNEFYNAFRDGEIPIAVKQSAHLFHLSIRRRVFFLPFSFIFIAISDSIGCSHTSEWAARAITRSKSGGEKEGARCGISSQKCETRPTRMRWIGMKKKKLCGGAISIRSTVTHRGDRATVSIVWVPNVIVNCHCAAHTVPHENKKALISFCSIWIVKDTLACLSFHSLLRCLRCEGNQISGCMDSNTRRSDFFSSIYLVQSHMVANLSD